MPKNKTGTIILVGAGAAAAYLIYKSMSASAASDSGLPAGSLGGSDSLLGDQGFNIDPNSAYPVPVYVDQTPTDPNAPANQQPSAQTPTGSADTYVSPDGTVSSGGSGTDWANLALQAAIFGAGSYAAEKGAKSIYDKWKSSRQLKTEEELKARGKTASEAERLSVEEQLKTEGKFSEGERVKLKEGVKSIDTMPEAERIKFGEDFKLSSEKVQTKFGEGKLGKAAGSAAEVLFLAQVGSNIVGEYKDRSKKGNLWGEGNIWDRISGSGDQQPFVISALGKSGEGVLGFATGLVYTPEWLQKYGYEDYSKYGNEPLPTGWFTTEKGIISGVGNIFSSQNVAQTTYNTASLLGVNRFLPDSWSGSSSSKVSTAALTPAQTSAQQQLYSAMGISSVNPFASSNQATYNASTGTYTTSSGAKMSMAASSPQAQAAVQVGSSSSSSSSKSTSSNVFGISTPSNALTQAVSKSTTPSTNVSSSATSSKAASVSTAPKTSSVVSNVVSGAKSAVSNIVSSIGSLFGGGKKK